MLKLSKKLMPYFSLIIVNIIIINILFIHSIKLINSNKLLINKIDILSENIESLRILLDDNGELLLGKKCPILS